MPGARRSIWVVDDSATDASFATAALGDEHDVATFLDGSTALAELATRPPPDVLVLDWVMPGVSGPDVCRFLRSSPDRASQVAILLVTAHRATDQVVEGLAAGANDYLVKPYAPEELRARVGALLRGRELLERVERAESRVARLFTLSPDAVLVADAHGRLTYANPEAERVLDRSAASVIGRPVSELLPDLDLRALRAGDGSVVPLRDLAIRGEVYAPSVRLLPDDFDAAATIALRNVTERRRLEDRRLDFYSIVAHDLRSPLSSMLLRTETILSGRRGILSAELINDMRKIENNCRSMVTLINDFLDLARLEGGGYDLAQDKIDFSAEIRTAVEELRPVLDGAGLTLALELEPTLPILGDRRRLMQVLNNLLGNAIKFTPRGGRITASLTSRGRDVDLRVSDNGPGIAPEALPTLFDRYTRANQDRSGTGLGLMIVREIVEAHGGKVGVESTLGAGSTFWVSLPVATIPASQPQILVVDDDPDIRESLELLLESQGYRTGTAENGQVALDALRAGNVPALIILDMSMPVMNGPELLSVMGGDPDLARVPVLIMSGDLSILPLAPPGALVMQKPIQVDRLLDHVARHLAG